MCRKPTKSATPAGGAPELSKEDAWIGKLDLQAFATEIRALGQKLEKEQGEADVGHLQNLLFWINTMGIAGFLTMGYSVNVFSVVCLSTFVFCRWTMVAHHTCHGGYDKCHESKRFHRFRFAIGSLWRRYLDWFDWMFPEAWNVEHNNRHHYHLGEDEDPDLVQNNNVNLREAPLPFVAKYVGVFFMACMWKWFYYTPNTYKELKLAQWRREGRKIPEGVKPEEPMTLVGVLRGDNAFYSRWEIFSRVMGPYLLIHFFLTPLPYLVVEHYTGVPPGTYYWNAVKNLALAEVLTNLHGFVAVVPNHAGDDMYRFRHPCRPFSGSFYLRQVVSSVDFAYGNDVVDLLHGWLNYQIEHHLWPNLSMRTYQKAAPLVKEICEKHGIPYVHQSVWKRVVQTANIMVGRTDMPWFPEYYEDLFLEQDAKAEQEKRAAFEASNNQKS